VCILHESSCFLVRFPAGGRTKSGREFFFHVAIDNRAERGGDLSPECASVERRELTFNGDADITLGWVLRGIERFCFEFTFPVRSRNIESELSSKPLGAGNFADIAMLIPFTTDSHFATPLRC